MAMRIAGRPASCQIRNCRQAARSTQRPIDRTKPDSSAIGMNCAGNMSPRCGCRQRIRASAPTIARVRRLMIGW